MAVQNILPSMSDERQHDEPETEDLTPRGGRDAEFGPLLGFEEGQALESHDRRHSGPGGDPECPRCGKTMVRSVELHRAPRSDNSPFRIRLVCASTDCRAWTAYNW